MPATSKHGFFEMQAKTNIWRKCAKCVHSRLFIYTDDEGVKHRAVKCDWGHMTPRFRYIEFAKKLDCVDYEVRRKQSKRDI